MYLLEVMSRTDTLQHVPYRGVSVIWAAITVTKRMVLHEF
jgi:hypothetical protein